MNRAEIGREWNRLVAEAWQDDDLRARLAAEPAAVLEEHGIELPAGVQVRTFENTDELIHLVIPTKPSREIADIEPGDATDPAYFYTIF